MNKKLILKTAATAMLIGGALVIAPDQLEAQSGVTVTCGRNYGQCWEEGWSYLGRVTCEWTGSPLNRCYP